MYKFVIDGVILADIAALCIWIVFAKFRRWRQKRGCGQCSECPGCRPASPCAGRRKAAYPSGNILPPNALETIGIQDSDNNPVHEGKIV